jgi:Txe/YoeB family toxin of Txe-Axe toxin-antitoxin module
MKVIITNRSLDRLEQSLDFYLIELKIPKYKVLEIKRNLINRAKDLGKQPYKGQYEPYLEKLGKEYRRIVEGNFKIVYRVENDIVYVVDFFDSHRKPTKMKG